MMPQELFGLDQGRTISDLTRRDIIDYIVVGKVNWSGRLEEEDFLCRLYNVKEMPSFDGRFDNAYDDIWQHRTNNPDDWPDEWIFDDSRFNLRYAPDEEFLRFLCEILHPAVRHSRDMAFPWHDVFNKYLEPDGWEIVPISNVSGRDIYGGKRTGSSATIAAHGAAQIGSKLNSDYIRRIVTRLHSSVNTDLELCIGTSKEFLESVAKTVLEAKGEIWASDETFPRLVKQSLKTLKLVPNGIFKETQSAQAVQVFGASLGSAVDKIAELRNWHGTGHGKTSSSIPLERRHAQLVMSVCVGLAEFIFESARQEGLTSMEIVEPVDESLFDEVGVEEYDPFADE